MSATTAPTVKARLVELFTSAVDGETEVWFNRTNTEHQINENVYVLGARIDREWKTLGRPSPHQREENYLLEVDVEVYQAGVNAEATENRMWQIVEQLDAAITADPTLGNQENVQWVLVEHIEQHSEGGADGWISKATLGIAVKARI